MLTGVLLLHSISDNIPLGMETNLAMIQELCGRNVVQNMIFVTTGEVKDNLGESGKFALKSMIHAKFGCQVEQFYGTHDSAWEIINNLIRSPHALPLQAEMVDEAKGLAPSRNSFSSRFFKFFKRSKP
jgi:hypothetical protein